MTETCKEMVARIREERIDAVEKLMSDYWKEVEIHDPLPGTLMESLLYAAKTWPGRPILLNLRRNKDFSECIYIITSHDLNMIVAHAMAVERTITTAPEFGPSETPPSEYPPVRRPPHAGPA